MPKAQINIKQVQGLKSLLSSIVLTQDITANSDVGGIDDGETVVAGTNLQDLFEKLLITIYDPTFTSPSFSLTDSISNSQEVGTTISVPLTFTFDRGSINGDNLIGNAWDPNAIQDFRAGASTSYTINGTNQVGNTLTVNSHIVQPGNNDFFGTVTYNQGPQPLSSDGNNFGPPYPGGTSPVQSTSHTGYYPYFYGTAATFQEVNDVITNIEAGNGTKVVASGDGTLTLNVGTSQQFVWFAIPSTSPLKVSWYEDGLNQGDIGAPGDPLVANGDLFVAFTNDDDFYEIDSPDGYWTNILYTIYLMKPTTAGTSFDSGSFEIL